MTFYDYLLKRHTRPTRMYGALIESATKCLPVETAAVESFMRDEHSTLDGLSFERFVVLARGCYAALLEAKTTQIELTTDSFGAPTFEFAETP